jgi:pimeloyl-ACP methyl ester carboxylesterase
MYEMGIARVALVGHGLGAIVAMLYALRNPEVVDRVMAVSYPMDENYVNGRLRTGSPMELAEWLLSKTPLAEPVMVETPKTDPQAIAASLIGLSVTEIKEANSRLTTSCLMVNGQNDTAVTPPDLDAVVSLPECTHVINFDQSGHFPMLDEGNKFNRLLVDFLSLASGESPRQLQLKEEWKRRMR